MTKYKRLRKIRSAIQELKKRNINVTYYYLKKNYEDGIIKGIEVENIIYLYFDELLKVLNVRE